MRDTIIMNMKIKTSLINPIGQYPFVQHCITAIFHPNPNPKTLVFKTACRPLFAWSPSSLSPYFYLLDWSVIFCSPWHLTQSHHTTFIIHHPSSYSASNLAHPVPPCWKGCFEAMCQLNAAFSMDTCSKDPASLYSPASRGLDHMCDFSHILSLPS